jgi:hypothetical protein
MSEYAAVLKLLLLMNALKYVGAISHVNAELKTNVSDTFSVSSIRVDVLNDHTSLIHIQIWRTFDRLVYTVIYDNSPQRPYCWR